MNSPRKRKSGIENKQYKSAERKAFFRRLDKGGTVRSVAAELGISPHTAYRWRHEAGVSTKRAVNREYSAKEKSEFFRLLQIHQNVSAVARELGFVRVTCYKWAHAAGIFTGRDVSAQRDEFLRLRKFGMSRAEAAQRTNIDKRTAQDWDKGIRQFSGGRIYPDGRVVRYDQKAVLANVKVPRRVYERNDQEGLELLDRPIHPRYLNLQEREQIHDLKAHGWSIRDIAREMVRSPSTISREISRNTQSKVGYLPYAAHRAAATRRKRPKEAKLLMPGPLRDFVVDRLALRWSPEQISQRMVKDFPDDEDMRVSSETIYQAVYVHSRGALKRQLTSPLRQGRLARRPRRGTGHRTSRFVEPMVSIANRPSEVDLRYVPGHWEGDLITGTLNKSAIGTLVERTTRYTMLVHLPHDHNAETVRDGLISVMQGLPGNLRNTLTWDQGAEMSEHAAFTIATDIKVYFCDPASPWQRGSNENTNGLLRQYFPKGTDLSKYSPDHLELVTQELNGRPRKTLNWESPAERLCALLETA
jgi:IS30 family transposase